MELSVVIPARNEATTIPHQLGALLAQSWEGEWEVIVVDNGSTDATASVVASIAEDHPRLRVVAESTPGLCAARNAGIAAAAADAIAICDADDIVADGWVAAMGHALRTQPFVTGPHELERLNPAWLAATRGANDNTSLPTFHGHFPYPNGNNFGLHRALFDAVGAFDQDYIGAEDVEFGMRAADAGYELQMIPAAVVHYAFRTSPRDLWRQGLGYGRARPAVARDLAATTGKRPSPVAGWKSWVWLLVNAPRAVRPNGRAALAWVAGNRVGHLLGSVRHRTLLL